MRRALALFAFALVVTGCPDKTLDKSDAPTEATPNAPSRATPADAPTAPSPIDWLHDDWASALEEAQAKGVPVVVDLWAPWCHTCVSMKQTVLKDPALSRFADQFVWLGVDTDRPENADVTDALPQWFWPTFYVVDASTKTPLARHAGAASVDEFVAMLQSARASLDDNPALTALRAGHQKVAAGDQAGAFAAFTRALETGGPKWPLRFSTRVSRLETLRHDDKPADCVKAALTDLDDQTQALSAAGTDFVVVAQLCADDADEAAAATAAAVLRAEAPEDHLRGYLGRSTSIASSSAKASTFSSSGVSELVSVLRLSPSKSSS